MRELPQRIVRFTTSITGVVVKPEKAYVSPKATVRFRFCSCR
jgi:hypothetical protein